jgi:copper chaperone CopZ
MPMPTDERSAIAATRILSTPALTKSAMLLAVGVTASTVALSFGIFPMALNAAPMDWRAASVLGAVGLAMLGVALWNFPAQVEILEAQAEGEPEPKKSTTLFGIYLVGIGFAMLLQAATCSIVFAGVAWSVGQRRSVGALPVLGAPAANDGWGRMFGTTPSEAFFIVGLFALSSLVAILGALFFFATALWKKMSEPGREPFDRRMFWGGLWFRIGEAILFNLVFFLIFRYYAPDNVLLLPLVSLLVGMFLKTGESLISGIAERVFASIQALVPADLSARRTMKLLVFKVGGFTPTDDPATMEKRVADVKEAVKSLAGVDDVEADPKTFWVRVEYNSAQLTVEDIERKVELKGLRIMSRTLPPPAEAAAVAPT